MMKEKLAKMEERLVDCLSSQIDMGIDKVDTEEAYKVVDIIKDLAEAKYYCTVTEAMEEGSEEDVRYYRGRSRDSRGRYMYTMTPEMYREHDPKYYRDMDRAQGRMYYTGIANDAVTSPEMMESRYDEARRNYTETKAMHTGNNDMDNQANMKSLEKIANVFNEDITEMIPKMTPSEKTMLKQKLTGIMGRL